MSSFRVEFASEYFKLQGYLDNATPNTGGMIYIVDGKVDNKSKTVVNLGRMIIEFDCYVPNCPDLLKHIPFERPCNFSESKLDESINDLLVEMKYFWGRLNNVSQFPFSKSKYWSSIDFVYSQMNDYHDQIRGNIARAKAEIPKLHKAATKACVSG